jgi:tetratricopeptide (TPR) repeat protein
LARAHSAAGEQAKAEQTLRRAVSVDPRFAPGYTMLAQLYMRQRRIDEARAEFEGIVQRDPSALGARTMVGILLEAQGKRDEARQSYEATVNGTGNAPVAANNLAFIYAEQGTNLDVALQLATSAKQRLPDEASVDDTIGWIYYKKELPALAITPLEDSIRKRPDAPEVLYHLGLTYAKLGNKTKARDVLARALKLDAKVGGDETRRVLASVSQ